MSYTQDDYNLIKKNRLTTMDAKFRFECKMCGNCCRNRDEPIIINGADVFRMAQALREPISDVLEKYTSCYLGENSHVPIVTLEERQDGSCRMLRKGRCLIQANKPAVCALYPLGRYYDLRDGSMNYFLNPNSCCQGCETENEWTLGKWLEEFNLKETEKMSAAFGSLVSGISAVTSKMPEKRITNEVWNVMMITLFLNYDTSRSYLEQVEENKALAKTLFKNQFHKRLRFVKEEAESS